MKKKLLALLLTAALALTILSGCGSKTESASGSSAASSAPDSAPAAVSTPETTPQEEAASVAEASIPEEEVEVVEGPVAGDKDFDWSVFEPLSEEPVTLTMFYTQPPPLAAIMDSPNDMSLLYQKFEEITNVHIDFQMVNMMDASTTFTLMIAGGDYCDIINDALNYYDTADQAYEDGIAVDNDLGLPSLKMANGVYLCTSGGFIYDLHKYDLEFTDLQKEAYTDWLISADDPSTVVTSDMPSGAKLTAAEADVVTTAMGDITTHVGEMALKFVTGAVELTPESYASYVTDIEGMRLQEALDAMQSAYDRYLSNQ